LRRFSGGSRRSDPGVSHRYRRLAAILLAVLLAAAAPASAGPAAGRTALPAAVWLDDPDGGGTVKSRYDVIVAGTDPEGVMAAVSAARNGLSVLLADRREQKVLGGLITLGWLNSLDMNWVPAFALRYPYPYLNAGLFHEWYQYVGGTSFDVSRAAAAFHKMVLDEPNIDLLLGARSMEPLMDGRTVVGMRFMTEAGRTVDIRAGAVIDATQDGDIAALAGAPYTYGREDLGEPHVTMAVTLVFKLDGVTDAVWREMREHPDALSDARSIWGYPEAGAYPSTDPERVRLRGLNIGRQEDGTALVNALHIFGVNPLDPASVEEGLAIGRREAPKVVDWLKERFPPFRNVRYGGTAPELYVRESRHFITEYVLTVRDLMENRDHWDAIAYGSYGVDVQSAGSDSGYVLLKPMQYGVPFRSLVPRDVDGLLIVGRAAGFSSLAHGSARVIPLGMATGEAAGAAAALAAERGMTFRELSRSREAAAELRRRLVRQGMRLDMLKFERPDYLDHPHYEGLVTAVSHLMAKGGYRNDEWALDEPANPLRLFNMIQRLHKMYPEAFPDRLAGREFSGRPPLSLEQAAMMLMEATGEKPAEGRALQAALAAGLITQDDANRVQEPASLTNGELYSLIRAVIPASGE
jgi:hypothetical protein